MQTASVPVAIPKTKSFMEIVNKAITLNQQDAQFQALVDKYEGKMKRMVIDALNKIHDSIKLQDLANLIAQNASESSILAALGISKYEAILGPVLTTIGRVMNDAGNLAVLHGAAGITGGPKIVARYDQTDPYAVEYLRNDAAQLVTAVTGDIKQQIRDTMADALYVGSKTPMAAARELRDFVGLTDRQAVALRNYRNYLINGDSRAVQRDIGGNAERIVSAAFRNGTMTPAKIASLVEAYRKRLLMARSGTIAATETFRAANTGAMVAWRQMADEVEDASSLRRFWVATNDGHTRDAHLAIVEMNEKGVGMDEPFQSPLGPIMYPGDPNAVAANSINCRCRFVVRYVDLPLGFLPPTQAGRSYLPTSPGFINQTRRG